MPGRRRSAGHELARQILADAQALPDCDDVADRECLEMPKTDVGNAFRLVRRFGHKLAYIVDVGWLVYEDGVWNGDDGEGRAILLAQKTVAMLLQERDRAGSKGQAKSHYAHWFKSQEAARIMAMLRMARPMLSVMVNDLDANPYLLNVKNGTLVLDAGDVEGADGGVLFRPSASADMMTRQCAVEFDPTADCPKWRKFLAECQPDKSIRVFLQRWAGYWLSGLTIEQALLLLWGRGSNGKSTYVDTAGYVLGSYAASLPFASLLYDERKRGGEATPDIARLPGRRFVRASEPETGVRFSEAMIKALTSSEAVPARHLHRGFFEFYPQFKLALSFNPKPDIRGVDEGIWRRLQLCPWSARFVDPGSDDAKAGWPVKDTELADKLRAEGPGILNWMLDGWRAYREMGLAIPDPVREATMEYRQETDRLAGFLAAAVLAVEHSDEPARDVFRAYVIWCRENAASAISQNAFGRAMTERGFKRQKAGTVTYKGVFLADEWRDKVRAEEQSRPAGHVDDDEA